MSETKQDCVRLDDFCFETDKADSLGLRSGTPFEPEVLFALRQLIKPGMVVLDLGANAGYFTAYMTKFVGSEGLVHAFEPEPGNFSLLGRNMERNAIGNVVLHQMALSDRAGIANLHISDFNGGMHRLYDSTCCGNTVVEVPMQRLDSMFSPGQISVFKMDVEGFEPFVLAGAAALIDGQDVKIVSEYCPPAMLEAGASLVTYVEQLKRWGLRAYETGGASLEWSVLQQDAQKWEQYGRERLVAACKGKTNPEIASIVDQQARSMDCLRPYIENLVFRSS
ncbi:MAG: FkbM family methyltransferase [Comamonadaceae bacterium]|jgi:FkbM family methyltransferase